MDDLKMESEVRLLWWTGGNKATESSPSLAVIEHQFAVAVYAGSTYVDRKKTSIGRHSCQ
jgi:hypothetical protein